MVRTTLSGVSDEWQVFIQSILGRERLPSWEEMWEALQQEELRRDLVKVNLNGNNESSTKTKEEEEMSDAAAQGKEGKIAFAQPLLIDGKVENRTMSSLIV